MAQRQTNELVDRIRLQRHRLTRTAGVPELFKSAARHARTYPGLWLFGGVALGALSVRLVLPGLVKVSRGVATHWLHSTIQGGVLSLAQGAFWSLWSPGIPGEVAAEWEDVPPEVGDAPLQASGGPVQPLRSS